MEQAPDNDQLWANLGDVLSFQKKHQEAVEAYGQALDLGHENFSTLYNMAAMQVSLGMKDKAEEFLKRAIAVSPQEGRAHYSLAVLLDQRKDHDGSQRHFLEAIRCGVDWPQGRFRLAQFFAVQSQPEEAMVHLTAAIRMEPQTYVPLVRRILKQVISDLGRDPLPEGFQRSAQGVRVHSGPEDLTRVPDSKKSLIRRHLWPESVESRRGHPQGEPLLC